MAKPKIGIFSLTCCEGCQLEILNCEDELLDIVHAVDIVSFGLAQSNNPETELDVAFVEGTVVMESEIETLKKIRQRSKLLVALGACAAYGGVAAIAYDVDRKKMKDVVYGADGALIPSITPSPLHDYVDVDLTLYGCPIEKDQFLKALGQLLHGDMPVFPEYPVCAECKRKENECVLIHHNIPCMGPVTRAGCNARCPSHYNGCDGCFGPIDEANVAMEYNILKDLGLSDDEIDRKMQVFAPTVDGFGKR